MSNEKLIVSLGKEGGTKTFDSLGELTTWLSGEQQFWSWLEQQPYTNDKQTLYQPFSQFVAGVSRQIAEANAVKNQAEQRKQEASLTQQLDGIRYQFKEFYENRHGIVSGNPSAKFIEQIRNDQGQGAAVAACGFLMSFPFNYGGFDGIRGAIAALLFQQGLKDVAVNEKSALEAMRVKWQSTFLTFQEGLQADLEKYKKLNLDGENLLTKQQSDCETMLKKQQYEADSSVQEQKKVLAELVTKSKDDWKNLKNTYDAELAIRAPVLYWRKKSSSHLLLTWVFAILSLIVGGGLSTLLFFEVKRLIEPPTGTPQPELWHPEYWRLAILIASGLVAVWIVRIIVRLFLSNLHLHTDANERVTMVQTYLALRRRGKITTDDESLILRTLFRPTVSGIMKDDGVPLTVLEAFTKLK